MRETISFLLGRTHVTLRDVDPTLTVLEYLRTVARRCGTKEGCAEGDCGACTVVLGELEDGALRYRAVNACIMFVPALDGRQLLTVEDLQAPDGALHPVQQALVEHHGSQCGFCTPGFVMSLFAMRQEERPAERAAINDGLAGNLCRCTGYRPIVDAAMRVLEEQAPDPFTEQRGATEAALRGCDTGGTLALEAAGTRFFAPRDLDTFARLFAANPEATLLAGGTDVGLWVTKQHRRIPLLISTEFVAGLRAVETGADQISIGAAVRYEDALGVLAAHWPSFGELLRRLGSRQIRNRGTIGGNLGNASPIGDSAPALLALDARLVLRRDVERREVPLDDFFTGYRTTILQPGEFIERILVPLPAGEQHFRAYKVAKRFDQDISAVCGAFRVDRAGGTVRDIRIAFGGMAATPARARRTEALLRGGNWSETSVTAAMELLADEFTPLSDWRASADYRRSVARNLLFKFWLETTGETARTHVLQAEDVA